MNHTVIEGPVRIIGSGLLGSSIGLRLVQLGVEVQLEDTSPAALALARDLGVGQLATSHSAAPACVIVATPPDVTSTVVCEALDRFPQAIVTDVASVKMRVLEGIVHHPQAHRYVGSHPMAGRERSGALAADADLFIGRPWVITPVDWLNDDEREEQTDSKVLLIQQLALAMGAFPLVMSAQMHDRCAAIVSHVPQLMASLVAGALRDAPQQSLELTGQGLRDVTRIAHSDSKLWATIIAGNATAVTDVLRGISGELTRLISALEAGNDDPFAPGVLAGVTGVITKGNIGVDRIPGKHGGAPRRYAHLFVLVPDEPGSLGRLLVEVGEAGVNIEDLHMEHSNNQQVGRAMLSVVPRKVKELAIALERRGWQVVVEGREKSVGVVIALDGPSGSGKSTVSRKVAERLGLSYLDTGAMYRALAWWCQHTGVDLRDQEAVAEASRRMHLDMPLDPCAQKIVCEGKDITQAIRTSELSKVVSAVATNVAVRAEMKRRQREIIKSTRMGIIAEGRDITSVVAPDADVRVLLTASQEARLARRALEVRGSADAQALAATRDEVVRRDADDSTVSEFMRAEDGVTTIDSSSMGIDEVVDAVISLVPEEKR